MKRTPVNPRERSKQFRFNQAEIIEGSGRQLLCSGQAAIGPDGTVQHPGDMVRRLLRLWTISRRF